MISHDEFSRLRLREFCPGDDLYHDELDEHAEFMAESIRGIWFGRPITRPNETFLIIISLLDYSTDAGPAILARVDLPFTRNTTMEQISKLLGPPEITFKSKPGDPLPYTEICKFQVGGSSGYKILCTFLEPGASCDWLPCYRVATRSLKDVRIERCDFEAVMDDIEARCP